jgi:hypothetical protein
MRTNPERQFGKVYKPPDFSRGPKLSSVRVATDYYSDQRLTTVLLCRTTTNSSHLTKGRAINSKVINSSPTNSRKPAISSRGISKLVSILSSPVRDTAEVPTLTSYLSASTTAAAKLSAATTELHSSNLNRIT